MTSSYSTDLKLELMVTGENAGTWGDKTNTNLNLIQQAIAGYESITITDSATTALVMSNAALSNARNMIIKIATITLTGATTVTIPDGIEKFYIFDLTGVTGVTNLTIKTATGSGFTAGEAKIVAAYSDGTNLNEIALNTLGGTIASAQIDDNAITAAKISNNAVTTAKILQSNVTTAKLAASAVTANNIAQSTITQAKLASNSVGADQLISTGVTAAEYTAATVTVDADGRITAASSGSGAANMQNVFFKDAATSFTYSPPPGVSKYQAFAFAGGGGGGGCQGSWQASGGTGGPGGFGFYAGPVTGGTNYSANVGGAGNGGSFQPTSQSPGNSGGSTSISGLFTVNAGGGGGGGGNSNGATGNTGSTGSAPGATHTQISLTALFDGNKSSGGAGGNPNGPGMSGNNGQSGSPGALVLYDNRG